jgi:hypothetical protein
LYALQRADIRSAKIRDCIIDCIILSVAIAMPITKREAGLKCEVPIVTWLIVAGSIYLLSFIKNIVVICAIHQPSTTMSPKDIKQKIEFLYICFVVNFEIGWLIYGNTFLYSDLGMTCMRLSSDTHQLWILMMLIVALGYVVMLMYFLVITVAFIGGCLVLFCYRD